MGKTRAEAANRLQTRAGQHMHTIGLGGLFIIIVRPGKVPGFIFSRGIILTKFPFFQSVIKSQITRMQSSRKLGSNV